MAFLSPTRPVGFWGLALPDLGAADDKTQARQFLASAGYTASNPLRVEIVARNLAIYRDMAAFVLSELKQVGVEAGPRATTRATATRRRKSSSSSNRGSWT